MRFGAPVLFSLAALSPMVAGPAGAAEGHAPRLPAFLAPQPGLIWSGPYVGLNAGIFLAQNQKAFSLYPNAAPAFPTVFAEASRFMPLDGAAAQKSWTPNFSAGAQIGYNYKVNERLMLGIEADIQRNGAGF